MWKKNIVLISVIAIILFSRFFPPYYAYLNTPDGYTYVGQTSAYDPWDINVYVAAIRYGQHGNVTLKNQYTTMDDREAIIYSLYTLTGNIFPGVDPYILYHALAALTIVIACVVIFVLSYTVLQSFTYSIVSMFLVLRGGGFGWLAVRMFGDAIPSSDLFYSNVTFTSALQKPHDGIGTLALITSILTYYFYIVQHKNVYAYVSIVSLILLMFFYPYYIVSYVIIVGAYSLQRSFMQKSIRPSSYFLLAASVASIVAMYSYVSITQSGFSMVTGEVIDKVGFLSFIFGYGVFIIIFIFALLRKNIPFRDPTWKYLVWWIVASICFSYLPIGYSRFYLRGLFFPLVLCTLIWVQQLRSSLAKQWIIVILCVIMPLTSLYVFFDRIQKANLRDPWQYTLVETSEMFEFLRTRKRDGVLSAYRLGSFVPAKTNKTVYLGHLFQTPDAQARMYNIFDFYSGAMSDSTAETFLRTNNITFVVYGRDERELGGHVYPFLKLLFDTPNTKLYAR